MELKTGDIIFEYTPLSWNPSTWISAIIRAFTKNKYTHCGVVILDWGHPCLYEADNKPITKESVETRLKDKYILVMRSKIGINEIELALKASSKCGNTGYDYWGVICQAIYILTGHWEGKTGIDASNSMYCS